MSEKQVRVINNRDRYYNGAHKWGILLIPASQVERYERVWFSVVQETGVVEIKENIVKPKTVKELKEILDHAGVEYGKSAKQAELQALVDGLTEAGTEDESEAGTEDIEALKQKLLDEAIVDTLEGLDDEAVRTIARENALID